MEEQEHYRNYIEMLKGDPNNPRPYDDHSRKGKFCWTKIGDVTIPVLFRRSIPVVCVYTLETQILHNFFASIHPSVYRLPPVISTKATDTEAKLLNQINIYHCDNMYGSYVFSNSDRLVTKREANLYYEFLKFVYDRISSPYTLNKKSGYVLINGESTVPFTTGKDGVKYVPFFYFEGHLRPLSKESTTLTTWEYCYLKVLTMAQGIRCSLYPTLFTPVVPLDTVKTLFEPGTTFADCALPEISTSHLMHKDRSNPQRIMDWCHYQVDLQTFQSQSEREPMEMLDREVRVKTED